MSEYDREDRYATQKEIEFLGDYFRNGVTVMEAWERLCHDRADVEMPKNIVELVKEFDRKDAALRAGHTLRYRDWFHYCEEFPNRDLFGREPEDDVILFDSHVEIIKRRRAC